MSAPTTREMCVAAGHPIAGTDDGRWGPDTADRCYCGEVSRLNERGQVAKARHDATRLAGGGKDGRRIREGLRALSSWIDASYPDNIDGELQLRRRINKVAAEYGEVQDALDGWVGENPRKGVTHTVEDVEYELLDVATAALAAIVSMHGNSERFDPVDALAKHVDAVAARAGLL